MILTIYREDYSDLTWKEVLEELEISEFDGDVVEVEVARVVNTR